MSKHTVRYDARNDRLTLAECEQFTRLARSVGAQDDDVLVARVRWSGNVKTLSVAVETSDHD